ncbi:MAG: RNA polymerase sigma factor RpoD/SigA [Candidatus Eisenbacteria bacterium]
MLRQDLIDEGECNSPFSQYLTGHSSPRQRRPEQKPDKSGESLSAYLRAISRIPLLTREEEQDLARRVRRGDVTAKERMVLANLRLVISIARRYQGMGLPLADLIGEGNLGLIKAVDRFKHEKGYRFSTYASKWIRQAVTKTLATDSRTVRLPANVIEIIRKVRATEETLLQNRREEPAEQEVCNRVGVSSSRYAQVTNASSTVSLDSPCSPDGDVSLHEVLADTSESPPDDIAFRRIDNTKLGELLDRLSKRERRILSYRFGLEDGNLRSLAETGKMVGITRERIRQIEKRAIEKMRRMMKKRRMRKVLMQGK